MDGGGGDRLDPLLLSALSDDYVLPKTQSIANSAIIAIFAFLVPLLTMEINYFRLAIYKSWRRQNSRVCRGKRRVGGKKTRGGEGVGMRYSTFGSEADVTISPIPPRDDVPSSSPPRRSDDDDAAVIEGGKSPYDDERRLRGTTSFESYSSASSTSSAIGHLVDDAIATATTLLGGIVPKKMELRRRRRIDRRNRVIIANESVDENPPDVFDEHDDENDDDGGGTMAWEEKNDDENENDNDLEIARTLLLHRRALHYDIIRRGSAEAILSSLILYSITGFGVGMSTRGLDPKVIAIIAGTSKYIAAVMIVIITAKVPQWTGVYHQGAIRLVKCSSNYSPKFEKLDLHDPTNLRKLRSNVRLGIWFHFSKFYILLMPFYCGVQKATIPLSYACGGSFGFVLMWAVFLVHEKYIRYRNYVSITTIFLLSILSSLLFSRGMASIQAIWNWHLFDDEDLLVVVSFFTWLAISAAVHGLFVWHTLRTEVARGATCDEGNPSVSGRDDEEIRVVDANEDGNAPCTVKRNITSRSSSKFDNNSSQGTMRRNISYSSFVFDPWTHFKEKEGKCQFSNHPDLDDDFTNDSTDVPVSSDPIDIDIGEGEQRRRPSAAPLIMACDGDENQEVIIGFYIETPSVVVNDRNMALDMDEDDIDKECGSCQNDDGDEGASINLATAYPVVKPNMATSDEGLAKTTMTPKKKLRLACCKYTCCTVFVWNTPEYHDSSHLWKSLCWIKLFVVSLSYLICLYFVAVSIGATSQISSTKALLPSVNKVLYSGMNTGPVCAFDNKGPESNITTFPDTDTAHDAGFLIMHCGACGACSSWQNLMIQYSTRLTLSELAHSCAQESIFGGGNDAVRACLMKPEIGFGEDCATCWMEDILCTKEHCAFIFLQSQMINNVGNFRVGPDEITSASCEEAHCEVGLFVPCVGATRRRMNIVSSISRPVDQQCKIVDVKDWEDLFFGSGVA